jgi:hypothetical protein
MADEPERRTDSPETGLFGRLPSARPGVRSPRRASERARARAAQAPPEPEGVAETPDRGAVAPGVRAAPTTGRGSSPRSPAQPGTAPEPGAPPGDEPSAAPEAPHGEGPGVEDLAWAGITVAAEAATLGVRLLNRALGAVRRPTEPR